MTFEEGIATIGKVKESLKRFKDPDNIIGMLLVAPKNQDEQTISKWIQFYVEFSTYPTQRQFHDFEILYGTRQVTEDNGSIYEFRRFFEDYKEFLINEKEV